MPVTGRSHHGMNTIPPISGLLAQARPATAVRNSPIFLAVLAIVCGSWLFYALPGIDQAVSRWFYGPDEGFALQNSPALQTLRSSADLLMRGIALLTLFQIARCALARRGSPRSLWLLSCLIVGPGLLVNGILKAYWGRPRPRETDIFGGEAPYQKVWVISDWCDRNCSFVSGEASSAFWLVAAALLVPRPHRTVVTALAAIYAAAVSLNRVAFGGHYLSDVVLAWLLCALVFLVLARLILPPRIEGSK